MYIRGLPRTMDPLEIKQALIELNYTPHRVANIQKTEGEQLNPRPLFRVELEPAATNPTIYNLTSILQVRIKVEAFRPRTDPPYCQRCQRLGHTKQYYLRTPHCIKCGDGHDSAQCTLSSSDPCKCANCGSPYPASYHGCTEYQKLRKKPHTAIGEIQRCGVIPSTAPTGPNSTPNLTLAPDLYAAVAATLISYTQNRSSQATTSPSFTPPTHTQQPPLLDTQTHTLLLSILGQLAEFTKRLDRLESDTDHIRWTTVQRNCNRRNV